MAENKIVLPVGTGAKCDHTKLVKRPRERMTKEQAWCGEWYDCPHRDYSVLVPSAELQAQLAEPAHANP